MATPTLDWPEAPGPKAPPTRVVPPQEMPYVRTEPRTTLRAVDPSTGAYRGTAVAPQPTPGPAAPTVAPTSPAAPTPQAAKPGMLGRAGATAGGMAKAGLRSVAGAVASPAALALTAPVLYAQAEEDRPMIGVGTVKDGSFLGNLAKRFERTGLVKTHSPGATPYAPMGGGATPNQSAAETTRLMRAGQGAPTPGVLSTASGAPSPETLRATNVTRVGNSFSGPANISGNITINGKTPGGGFMVADPAGRAADATMAARYDARMATEQGANQNATVMSGRTYGVLGLPTDGDMFKQRSGETGRNYRARMAAMQSDAASLRGDATTRRGQDFGQESDVRRDGTTRRGQDMDLQGRVMPKQMELEQAARMRGLRAEAFKASGGDYSKMADTLAAYGLDPSDALKAAGDKQTLGTKSEEQARGIFKNMFDTLDKDGKPVGRPDLESRAYASLMKMTDGKFNSLPKALQDQYRTQAIAEVQELSDANANMPGGVFTTLGIDGAPTPYSNLPSAAERSPLRRPTLVERFNPFDDYTMDADNWVEDLRDGRKYVYGNLPEDRIKSRQPSGGR